MQLVLLEKIKKLGNLGDIVKVKAGYARNFLIPKGKAVFATKENLHKFEEKRAELEVKADDLIKKAEDKKAKLEGLNIEIKSKASDEGRLYGSIGPKDIMDAIKENGIEVEKQNIIMSHGLIRQTGEFEVNIHLHSDIQLDIMINVVADK